jgi:SAM-dependent methyltransferase
MKAADTIPLTVQPAEELPFVGDGVLTTIRPFITGRDVLDVGCVEHSLDRRNRERLWVHDFLRRFARSVVGIDIESEEVKRLQAEGYDVYCGNAETFDLGRTYDVVFAGELIEHLANPGLFLERCRRHLGPEGLLILTTPNAFSLYCLLKVLVRWSIEPCTNAQHTCWYSPEVLRHLLGRCGFTVNETRYVDYPHIAPPMKYKIIRCLSSLMGSKFKDTMIVVARSQRS